MPQFSNKDKQEHGKNAKRSLEEILKACMRYSYIKEIIKGYRCGYENYDDEQFYCNFIIVFQDDTKWIVNITNTFRSDRVKGNQWDSFNIKKINPEINKSLLVYPDGISKKEKTAFITYKLKVENDNDLLTKSEKKFKKHFSSIDYIVSQSELFECIESYANKNLSNGSKKGKQGNNFESYISNILSDFENLKRWKTGDPKLVGVNYDIFEKIINKFNLDKSNVVSIQAMSDKTSIGRLTTKGPAKTDIIVAVHYLDKYLECFTISCKKTTEEFVTVHQSPAKIFPEVLDVNNKKLANLLEKFQIKGTIGDLDQNSQIELKNELVPYNEKLATWALGGFEGHIQNPQQIAKYILLYDGKNIYFHSVEEYVKELLKPENEQHFGTPFRWTYPSKHQGKAIQFKCKVLKDF